MVIELLCSGRPPRIWIAHGSEQRSHLLDSPFIAERMMIPKRRPYTIQQGDTGRLVDVNQSGLGSLRQWFHWGRPPGTERALAMPALKGRRVPLHEHPGGGLGVFMNRLVKFLRYERSFRSTPEFHIDGNRYTCFCQPLKPSRFPPHLGRLRFKDRPAEQDLKVEAKSRSQISGVLPPTSNLQPFASFL